jgi:phosphohistidine phosphatase SixA
MRGRLLILLVCITVAAGAGEASDHYTLYLVRHAEKLLDDGDDPGLADAGKQRSAQMAGWLRDKGITDIWSSDYRRSRDTAAPLAAMLGSEVQLYDPRDLPALVKNLRENRHNALIVGHSNTTPDLARLLCVCLVGDMDDTDYDQLLVVSVAGDDTVVKTLSQDVLFRSPGSP